MKAKHIKPVCWSIAGFDPSAYAGLLADMRSMAACGVTGQAISTCHTAQNRTTASMLEPIDSRILCQQIETLLEEAEPHAIKIGLLPQSQQIKIIAKQLRGIKCPKILDPVATASAGLALVDKDWSQALRQELLPQMDLVTPNATELAALIGRRIDRLEDLPMAAEQLRDLGARAVLIKGGHIGCREHPQLIFDYYLDDKQAFWLKTHRLSGEFRGTGCFLSSATAAYAATGLELSEALIKARVHLQSSLQLASSCADQSKRIEPATTLTEMVAIGETLDELRLELPSSPRIARPKLGLYPIVDRASWLRRLLPQGVRTIQLRIKDLGGSALREEIREAIEIARRWQTDLYINDYWDLAIELGATGVHLGQEDLQVASLQRIKAANLRLGVSTHSFSELGRAVQLKPSYIALGPVFPTSCKSMRFGPQGFQRLAEWKSLCDVPLVAIGGLKAEHCSTLREINPSGIALISDILQHPNPESRTRFWLRKLDD